MQGAAAGGDSPNLLGRIVTPAATVADLRRRRASTAIRACRGSNL